MPSRNGCRADRQVHQVRPIVVNVRLTGWRDAWNMNDRHGHRYDFIVGLARVSSNVYDGEVEVLRSTMIIVGPLALHVGVD